MDQEGKGWENVDWIHWLPDTVCSGVTGIYSSDFFLASECPLVSHEGPCYME